MTNKNGFTLVELIVTLGIMTFIMLAVMTVYQTCIVSYNAGRNRADSRNTLSQALEVMSNDLRHAQGITSCTVDSITFQADLSGTGAGVASYRYYLNASNGMYNLIKGLAADPDGQGQIKASNLKNTAGAGASVFSCTNGLITIKLTAVTNKGTEDQITVKVQSQLRPRNIPEGMVGWWKFDEGSTASDSSGNNNSGTLTGSPPWVSGKIGGALSYDGATQWVSLGNPTALHRTSIISISAWIKIDAIGLDTQRDIVSYGNNGYVFYMGADNKLTFGKQNVSGVSESTALTETTSWHHVAVTYDSSNNLATFYVDGLPDGTPAYSQTFAFSNSLYIGANSMANDKVFYGLIDDVRIYNRSLSDNEVKTINAAGQ